MSDAVLKKDTSELLKELHLTDDFKSFYVDHKDDLISSSLSELLDRLMKEKKLSKAALIRESELSEVYAYQIFSGKRLPERKKLLCLAVAMKLTAEEVQVLLKQAGYPPLYVKKKFDSIVAYGLCKKMSVSQINEILFDYGEETLG